ncbi:MAG: deoxyhypusine synthase [Gemmatimonadota bacterium]|nr:deoxyhypusine synthase [Gemmatimonadota bacterium]MDQ6885795.1 deoxyhypusine synthase [Gemmatimonadota bacterium]
MPTSERPGKRRKSVAGAPPTKARQKHEAEARERGETPARSRERSRFLGGQKIDPRRLDGRETVAELIEGAFLAYNAARLREACQLFTEKMLEPHVTVGLSITGALTPAGLGMSALIPLIEAGFVDWIISTGANLYHDAHFGLGLAMHRGNAQESDVVLREEGVVRIYDIFFDYEVLLSTDAFFRQIIQAPEFQRAMSSAEFHWLAGKYVRERERRLGIGQRSLLSAAHACGVPIYTSSPGDSSIGMNIAAVALDGNALLLDPNQDVNETAAIVLDAKRGEGRSAVMILGGGSPKNFLLQTEPQIQEVLGIDEKGHDYFLQITDARPDTGGLSGATPGEAVSWGKIDPDRLPDAVVCYADSTIALPLLTSYALARHRARPLKRLFDRRDSMMRRLRTAYQKSSRGPAAAAVAETTLPRHR